MHKQNHYTIGLCVVLLIGCNESSDVNSTKVKNCEAEFGKLITVADKIEIRDGRLLITHPTLSENESLDIKTKSLLFSKLAIVDMNVGMLVATPYVPPLQFVVDVDIASGHVVVVDVDADGNFGDPHTEAIRSLEVLPP